MYTYNRHRGQYLHGVCTVGLMEIDCVVITIGINWYKPVHIYFIDNE